MTRIGLALVLATLTLACRPESVPVAGEPGTPIAGLSDTELARFHAGRALFNKVFTAEEGLGPAFNENQCSACHTDPAPGGTGGFERVVKATRYDSVAGCDLLSAQGGENIRKNATPALRAHGVTRESVPTSATETGRFLTPFLFGLGLVESIPESVIEAGADPHDEDGDGISGRAARGPDGRITRFGVKADFATIEQFTRGALRLEMGLTSRAGEPDLVDGAPAPPGTDPRGDPEVDDGIVQLLTDFTRFLTPPAQAPARSKQHGDTLAAGRLLFGRLGCASCHTPSMRTGPHEVAALSDRTVHLYSDLLLHDMGPELANICAPDAAPRELRTSMLMGLQYRSFYMHDGRALDLREAIQAHGGEAAAVRDAFARLPYMMQENLLTFLRSL